MSEAPGVAALRRYSAQRSRDKAEQVVSAIETQIAVGSRVSVSGIAKSAGVSREFIYEHPELLAAVRRAREMQPRAVATRDGLTERESGLLAERGALIAKIQRQSMQLEEANTAIAHLEEQKQRWLGAQLDSVMQPARIAELASENERLSRRVFELTRLSDQLQRAVSTLTEELRISRIAHAETAADLRSDHAQPLPRIHPERGGD